jgi:hypothetical protein
MNVFEHFACHTVLPIKIDDVIQHILDTGIVDRILLIQADLDPTIELGFLRAYRTLVPYGEGVIAEIYYSSRIPQELARLVIVKELLHLLDNHSDTAQTREEMSKLITDISVPMSVSAGTPGISDHTGMLLALMVLIPRDSLGILKEHYATGRLSLEQIVALARIPAGYVQFVLESPAWQALSDRSK